MAKRKKDKKSRGIGIAILCIFLAIVIGFFAAGFSYWNKLKEAPPAVEDTLTYDFDDETVPETLEDAHEFEKIYEGDATTLKDSIRQWATNGGEVMYSDNVINVICVGVDNRNKNSVSGMSDTMIICSVNTEKGEITFTSVMRDSYAYLESPEGVGSFNKINSAFPFYGIDNLINTIESHFKIRIDGYAMVNFALFKAVIDEFGGVSVPVQEYEANYINGSYGFNIGVGDSVKLNGDEALAFCRSRKCDSDGDVSRTRRQRQVMMALLQEAKNINPSEVADYVALVMPYLKSNYTEGEVLSLATKAVVSGWSRFSVNQILMPDENSRKAHSGDTWYWEVDYPLAAQTLQNTIYGESNIELSKDRVSPLDM